MLARIIPALLLINLIVMVILGWPEYRAGATSGFLYFGGTALTLVCILLLYCRLRRATQKRHPKR